MKTPEGAAQQPFDAQAQERFEDYVLSLGAVVGNDARRRGLRDYVRGLLLPGQRKSMEPIAERLDPDNVSRRHQALHHFISEARWSDAAVLARVHAGVLPALEERAPVEHLIIDDTPLHKSGRHSVGVAVQYSGRIRTTTNCQALVSLSVSNGQASLPVACQLYLPADWASDHRRRLHAGVPAAVPFRTKHEMALEQLRRAKATGLPGRIVLMDGAFGTDGGMRAGVRALDLEYAAAVSCDVLAVACQTSPTHRPRRGHRAQAHAGAARLDVLARTLGSKRWQEVAWREEADELRRGRFAALRVRTAPSQERGRLGPEEWLLAQDADTPDKRRFWLISLPADTPLNALVRHAKGRCRIEQDYRELKQEIGLAHFEGRSWRGLHHHITLCLAAYGFLVRERSLSPLGGAQPAHPHSAP